MMAIKMHLVGLRQLQLVGLLLLSLVGSIASAPSPVTSPEIANKPSKTVGGGGNSIQVVSAGAAADGSRSTSGTSDAHLNSLTVYAGNYENLVTAAQQQQQLHQQQQQHQQQQVGQQSSVEPSFKPSYKMPEMETNFTPMQSIPSTPMLMQYLPAQTLQDGTGAVQYLQLIPTRPIIVPISPYLGAAAAAAAGQANGHPGSVTGLHYAAAGIHSFANAMASPVAAPVAPPMAAYRSSYRINREAKEKNFPPTFSLNMHEYLPSMAQDTTSGTIAVQPQQRHYIRSRS